MKTIKEIADALGVDKQRVYRYIKKHRISEAHQEAGVMWYDEVAETLIIQHFSEIGAQGEAHHEAHQTVSPDAVIDTVIAMLQAELDAKNRLISTQQQNISELTAALENTTASLHAAQALHAGTMQKQLSDGRADQREPQEPQGFFTRFFKRKTP